MNRATASAAELSKAELIEGRRLLESKVERFRPKCAAIVGIEAFRAAFEKPHAGFGRQKETFSGAILWALPNTSGLNAHFKPADMARAFKEMRVAMEAEEAQKGITA